MYRGPSNKQGLAGHSDTYLYHTGLRQALGWVPFGDNRPTHLHSSRPTLQWDKGHSPVNRCFRKACCRWNGTDTQTGMLPGIPGSAMCVQGFDDSLNSAIHTTYRISLRPSSLRLPRHPWFAIVKGFCFSRPQQWFLRRRTRVLVWFCIDWFMVLLHKKYEQGTSGAHGLRTVVPLHS